MQNSTFQHRNVK